MGGKYSFRLRDASGRQELPPKIIVGQQDTEALETVLLKALGFLLFFRERLQIGVELHADAIPFRPDLVQLDYELRPKLWVECGEPSVGKLDKLSVKVPEAEIWVIHRSLTAAEALFYAMTKASLRRNRYHLIGLDGAMFDEVLALLRGRNEVFWVQGSFDPPLLQFDFNGLWFDAAFVVSHF